LKRLTKVAIGIAGAAVVGVLFVRSVRQTGSEPYTVEAGQLRNWTLAFEEDSAGPSAPFLVLQGPSGLPEGLSHQIFKRAMESLSTAAGARMPLLLRGEFDRALAGRVTKDQIVAAARNAGLGRRPLVPRCLGHRRTSDVGSTRQVYFLLFDLPAFQQFRREVGVLSGGGASNVSFDPAALSPIMFVANEQSSFDQWLPLAADPAVDCVSPITVGAGEAR
jgi:hypothetical protein